MTETSFIEPKKISIEMIEPPVIPEDNSESHLRMYNFLTHPSLSGSAQSIEPKQISIDMMESPEIPEEKIESDLKKVLVVNVDADAEKKPTQTSLSESVQPIEPKQISIDIIELAVIPEEKIESDLKNVSVVDVDADTGKKPTQTSLSGSVQPIQPTLISPNMIEPLVVPKEKTESDLKNVSVVDVNADADKKPTQTSLSGSVQLIDPKQISIDMIQPPVIPEEKTESHLKIVSVVDLDADTGKKPTQTSLSGSVQPIESKLISVDIIEPLVIPKEKTESDLKKISVVDLNPDSAVDIESDADKKPTQTPPSGSAQPIEPKQIAIDMIEPPVIPKEKTESDLKKVSVVDVDADADKKPTQTSLSGLTQPIQPKQISIDMIEHPVILEEKTESYPKMLSAVDLKAYAGKKPTHSSLSGSVQSHDRSKNDDDYDDLDRLDYERLRKTINDTHARKEGRKPYGCFEACCQFNTGHHGLTQTSKESDVDKFGAGITLYFRFVKYLACFFFIFTILSAPSLFFSIQYSLNFSQNNFNDYREFFYFTTVGSIGRGASECIKAKDGEKVTISCERGNIGHRFDYGLSFESDKEPCELFSIASWANCTNDNLTPYSDCEGKQSCEITVDKKYFDFSKPGCSSSQNSDTAFYFKALCDNIWIELPGGYYIDKKTVGYIIVSLDGVISLLYVIMLLLLKKLEKKTVFNIEGNVEAVDAYSIKVSHLPEGGRQFLRRELWKHFSEISYKREKKMFSVVDVQLAESQAQLDLQTRMGLIRKKKNFLCRRFYKKWTKKVSNDKQEITYGKISEIAEFGTDEAKKEFKKIEKLKDEQKHLLNKISNMSKHASNPATAAFVTFETRHQRDEVYRIFQKSSFARLSYIICGAHKKDPNVFHDSYIKIKDAPAPNNILWGNFDVSKTERFLRRLLSWFITIGFWAISFGFIVFVKSEQNDIQTFVGSKSEVAKNGLSFIIVIAIIFTNYGFQYAFKLLSSFERYQSITTESTSRVIKIFVAQLLNTGLIILVVNARFSNSPLLSFLEGRYHDLIPEWYLNIGTTLLITMIINIVNLPIINTFFALVRGCLRCCDRGCSCDYTKTHKIFQEEWEKLYTGPEFLVDFRYAQILTVVFICFFYSAGLPLLYLSTSLNLLAFYWMDKIFLLKICKLPRIFDDKLENIVREAFFIAIFFHLVIAVWAYGSPQIFGDKDSFSKVATRATDSGGLTFGYFLNSLFTRAIQDQIIVLTSLFSNTLFRNTIVAMFNFCFGKHMCKIARYKDKDENTYFSYISLDDLNLEEKYLKREIKETNDKELKELLQKRLEKIHQAIRSRGPAKGNHFNRFIGLFSYNIGHNPAYKKYFDTEKRIKPEDLEENQ